MLLKFEVSNYKSFKNKSGFSMVTKSKIREKSSHETKIGDYAILKYASIFGGNASGKTNIFSAMQVLKNLLDSQDLRNVSNYKDSDDKSIMFNVIFHRNNKTFRYYVAINMLNGFNNYEIDDEQLFELDLLTKKESVVFDKNGISKDYISSEKGVAFIENLYFENCKRGSKNLFLSFFSHKENKIENSKVQAITTIALQFFLNDLVFVTNDVDGFSNINNATIKSISSRLSLYDTGINNIQFIKCDPDEIVKKVPKSILDQIYRLFEEKLKQNYKSATFGLTNGIDVFNFNADKNGNIIASKIVSNHRGFTNYFQFDEESDGSRRLILLCALLFSGHSNDKVYIFDEFEKSIHPKLAVSILEDFFEYNAEYNSQLIITSHLPELMDSPLRKDEIFVVSKNPSGVSTIKPIMVYDIRSDTKISKSYLNGRYGGIPNIDRRIL